MEQTCNAYAKVNLCLDVLRKREDGYHDVKMIMQTVNLYDTLTFEKMDSGIDIVSDLCFVNNKEDNLIYKAIKLLFDEFNIKEGIKVILKKNIPVAAGMAGGSTDCATTLKCINELFNLGLSQEELMHRGVRLGADVPYCIMGGTALSEGIGEILRPIKGMPDCKVLIAKPNVNVSTKFVYENLNLDKIKHHPDVDGMISLIQKGDGDIKGIASKMENVLETVTVKEYPLIEEIKDFMKKTGALNAIMSGSGPTVFGLFDNDDKAQKAHDMLRASDITKQVFLTDLINR